MNVTDPMQENMQESHQMFFILMISEMFLRIKDPKIPNISMSEFSNHENLPSNSV